MKFGKVDCADEIDFTLPEDHGDTSALLKGARGDRPLQLYVGCAKWGKKDLKNFYPRGTKDELPYYSLQFNSIELNATFYGGSTPARFVGWREKTPEDFMFFPKLPQLVSHRYRLKKEAIQQASEFLGDVDHLDQKLGTVFLQMPDNFGPHKSENRERLVEFVSHWPKGVPLAVELRHADWFMDPNIAGEVYALFEEHNVTNIITDTAGRRELIHMRLTSPRAFIRYVGANHASDATRLDDWVDRLETWVEQGIEEIAFFVHQNHELESPLLAAGFIEKLNRRIGSELKVPATSSGQNDLF